MKILTERGFPFTTTAECEIGREGEIGLHCPGLWHRDEGGRRDKEKKTHELPDDNIITVGSERFRCYESETASCRLPTFVKKKHN